MFYTDTTFFYGIPQIPFEVVLLLLYLGTTRHRSHMVDVSFILTRLYDDLRRVLPRRLVFYSWRVEISQYTLGHSVSNPLLSSLDRSQPPPYKHSPILVSTFCVHLTYSSTRLGYTGMWWQSTHEEGVEYRCTRIYPRIRSRLSLLSSCLNQRSV